MMIRIKTVLMAAISAWLLASCSKEQVSSTLEARTIEDLGFEWNVAYSACLDSDDQTALWCGDVMWLDAERLKLELFASEAAVSSAEKPLQKLAGVQIIRYRYLPGSKSVLLFLEGGEVNLLWEDPRSCLNGDVFSGDFLTVCLGGTGS